MSNKLFVILVVIVTTITGWQIGQAKSLAEQIDGSIVTNPRIETHRMTTQFGIFDRFGAWNVFGINNQPATFAASLEGGECLSDPKVVIKVQIGSATVINKGTIPTYLNEGSGHIIPGRRFEVLVSPLSMIDVAITGTWTADCFTEFKTFMTSVKCEASVLDPA